MTNRKSIISRFISLLFTALVLAPFLLIEVQADEAKRVDSKGLFLESLSAIELALPETGLRIYSEIPDDLFIADNSVFVITPDEMGPEQEFDFSLNILPGNTLAMFHLACTCNYESLSEIEKISLKEMCVKGIKGALNKITSQGIGPGEKFRKKLSTGVLAALETAALNESTFDLASSTMQCQYQIQSVSENSVGLSSAWAAGSDFHILVLVFFDKLSRKMIF